MSLKCQIKNILCVIVMVAVCASTAGATLISACGPYSFDWVLDSEGNIVNGDIGRQQFSFSLSEVQEGVYFEFTNTGPMACSLTDLYIESSLGTLTEIVSIDDSCFGVSFSQGSAPINMPRWKTLDFKPAPDLTFQSDSQSDVQNGTSHNGINPGEWLGITLSSRADIEQIYRELDRREIRIGIHVQAFPDGGSESFISTPEPATMVLLGLGTFFMIRI